MEDKEMAMAFIRDRETNEIVDPERNAVLKHIKGYSTGDKDWEIHWNGEVIGFTARDNRKYGGETKNILIGIDWFVASLKIPDSLKDKRSEIMGLIRDSMKAYGLKFPELNVECHVQFDQRLIR